MNKPQCDSCLNQEEAFVFNGARYVEQPVCLYGMQLFPKVFNCDKYEAADEPHKS